MLIDCVQTDLNHRIDRNSLCSLCKMDVVENENKFGTVSRSYSIRSRDLNPTPTSLNADDISTAQPI